MIEYLKIEVRPARHTVPPEHKEIEVEVRVNGMRYALTDYIHGDDFTSTFDNLMEYMCVKIKQEMTKKSHYGNPNAVTDPAYSKRGKV